jgi:hypothetical protein
VSVSVRPAAGQGPSEGRCHTSIGRRLSTETFETAPRLNTEKAGVLTRPSRDHSAFEAGSIVRFEKVNERRGLRLETDLGTFASEPFLLFRIVVGSMALHSF